MYYVYENHLYGNAYISYDEYDYDELYCEQCGDSDWLLNVFETKEEAKDYVKKYNNGEIE